MQLSLKTDYALRILMVLAAADEVRSVDWIAEHYGISRNHLAKVAQHLASAGFVETVRGRGGGMRLALAPEDINVGAVVRDLERFEGFVACMGARSGCGIDGRCGLKPVLGGALDAFLGHLDGYTLADIIADRRAMLSRFHAEPA